MQSSVASLQHSSLTAATRALRLPASHAWAGHSLGVEGELVAREQSSLLE